MNPEMAAYAALVSLSHTIHHILHPPPLRNILIPTQQIEFLLGRVVFMIDFLETQPSRRSDEVKGLQTRIFDAAHAAEDIIESNVVKQIHANGEKYVKYIFNLLCEGLITVIEKFHSIEKELMEMRVADLQPKVLARSTSSRSPPGNNLIVGFERHVNEMMDALATDEPNRRVISIVGMGGIGKTLAAAVFSNPFIVEHFHVRVWETVSQEYSVRDILRRLLSATDRAGLDNQGSTGDGKVDELVYKRLYDRKYLIVMDDMWDTEVWDEVKRFLPPNNNGSRFLVATRLSNLADDLGSCNPYRISFLDREKSWELLREKVFGKEECPVELERVGKDIAKRCSGLPLAIVVIGGLPAMSEKTRAHWKSVAEDVTSAFNYEGDVHLMKILSLSYVHLPIYLKPCFLYLAVVDDQIVTATIK